jgi:EPS-associated MarR family transcriptional regulator
MISEELRYKLLKVLGPNPQLSQRDLARELGISLGRVNYCMRALMDKGWLKAANFKNSRNKIAYMYLLTPRGLEGKTRLTTRFLQIKLREFEELRDEIEQIRSEAAQQSQR